MHDVRLPTDELEDLINILDWEIAYDEGAEPDDRERRKRTLARLQEAV